jgi:hypothetical protein
MVSALRANGAIILLYCLMVSALRANGAIILLYCLMVSALRANGEAPFAPFSPFSKLCLRHHSIIKLFFTRSSRLL